ncbi:hypothetical protein [Chryseobacterium taichungense]|uniref:hypothetical protein n=1 Tax=Chryseobacterium taichungense TaxID=295069 RepID=UPI0028AE1DE2|nr:hypothetical protein [Chryseobacterium taichungense]
MFYSHQLDKTWILSSEEFIAEAVQNKSGKISAKGLFGLMARVQKNQSEHPHPRFNKYLKENFDMFK